MRCTEGDIFTNRKGCKAVVIEYINSKNVRVRFLDRFKLEASFRSDHLNSGRFKNPYYPSVQGVGFVGVGRHKISANRKCTRFYRIWRGMISRCYSKNTHDKRPTYDDCTVHPEWHDFQVFASWCEENYIEGCDLDKDLFSGEKKVYSSKTCCFLNRQRNAELSHAKYYKFIDPSGEIVRIYNLSKFCRDNALNESCMRRVSDGFHNSHKGWRAVTDE